MDIVILELICGSVWQAMVFVVGGGNYIEYQNLEEYVKVSTKIAIGWVIDKGYDETMDKVIHIVSALYSPLLSCWLKPGICEKVVQKDELLSTVL